MLEDAQPGVKCSYCLNMPLSVGKATLSRKICLMMLNVLSKFNSLLCCEQILYDKSLNEQIALEQDLKILKISV